MLAQRTLDDETPKGIVGFLVIVAFLLFISWDLCRPVSLYFVLSAIGYVILRRSTNPWAKAAAETALPAAIAFGFLTAVLIVVNLFYAPGVTATESLSRYELFIVRFSESVAAWTRLKWWELIGIYVLLICAVRFASTWKPVNRFVAVKRYAGIAAQTLSFIASLSFFTNDAVLGNQAARAERHITVSYTDSRGKERQHLERYLATRSIRESFSQQPAKKKQLIGQLVRMIAEDPALPDAGKAELVDYVAAGDSEVQQPSYDAQLEPTALDVRLNAESLFSDQKAKEGVAADLQASEEKKAFEEIFGTVLGSAVGALQDLGKRVIERLGATQVPEFLSTAKEYLDKVKDKYFERLTDPFVKSKAARAQEALDAVFARSKTSDSDELPRYIVHQLVLDRVNQAVDQIRQARQQFSTATRDDAIITSRRIGAATAQAELLARSFGFDTPAKNSISSAALPPLMDETSRGLRDTAAKALAAGRADAAEMQRAIDLMPGARPPGLPLPDRGDAEIDHFK